MAHPILLVSAGIFHPPWLGRVWLRHTLGASPNLHVQRVPSLEALPALPAESFHALILYFHHKRISPVALETLDAYVRGGGGILAIHSATASFKDEDAYFNILGGRFTGHGPVESFLIQPEPSAGEIFESPASFTVKDELYRHETLPDIRVHFSTPAQGGHEAMVWTRTHGRGRVCCLSPGHRPATMRHPQIQEIIMQGLEWVCASQGSTQEAK